MVHKFYKRVSFFFIGAFLFPMLLLAQSNTTGKVTDAEGNALADVSVQVKGKKELNATNKNGIYFIKAAGNDVLIFSSVGFGTVELKASEAATVKLKTKTATLSDVVVVGFGEKKRKNITSAIGSVTGEELRKSPVASIDQALAGRVAGVEVTASTGDPGGKINIRIRGNTTVSSASSNDPLFVVDDLVLPAGASIASISPSDILSFDVLKDAAATSIYGIRAANGVVVIKTKKGTKDKNRISFDMFTGINQPWKRLKVLNIKEHAEFNNDYYQQYNIANAGIPSFVPEILNPEWSTPARIANLPTNGTNWQDEIFQTGFFRDANLSFSGGSAKTTYYFSVGNRDEKGIILNSTFKRTNLRANIDNQVNDWLRMGVNVAYSDNRRTVIAGTNEARSSGLMQGVLLASPSIPVFASNGTPGVAPINNPKWYGNVVNPRNRIEGENTNYRNNDLYGSGYANIKLPYGFSFNSTLGVGQFAGKYSTFGANLYNTTAAVEVRGQLFSGNSSGLTWNWDNYINWNRWIKGHAIEVTVGHVAQGINNEGFNFNQKDFTNQAPAFQLPGLGSPSGIEIPPTYPQAFTYESYFGRLSYNFKERYYFGAAYRIDKASPAFTTKNKTAYFPALSAKWRLTKEKFFEGITFFNDLSIRGSWGLSGNIGNNPYTGFQLLKINSNYPFSGGTSTPGVSLAQFPNTEATWEKIYQTDIGIDATMLDGKISLTLDWYSRNTQNMLLPFRLRGIFGNIPSPPITNIPGKGVTNNGVEISLGYRSKAKKDFNYNVNGNISFNKNRVVDIGNNPFISLKDDDVNRTAVGQPIGSFFGWKSLGIFQSQDEINKSPIDELSNGGSGAKPGDIRYEDINGDGKINFDDRTYIGQPTPTYTYGLNLSANYKAFDFSLLIQGVGGNQIFNKLYQQATVGDDGFKDGINRLAAVKDRWVNDGQTHALPRISYRSNELSQNNRMSDFWLQNGAFTRIKNVQIGYTLPNNVIKKVDIEKLRVYVSASNLFTFTKYKGFDPEVGQNTTGYADIFGNTNRDLLSGTDNGVFPQPRMILVGVNLTF